MAPTDKLQLPFRWSFIPEQDARDGSIRWSWRAYAQNGMEVMQSEASFEAITECMDDAKARGYGRE
jgi:hypothetical protein